MLSTVPDELPADFKMSSYFWDLLCRLLIEQA